MEVTVTIPQEVSDLLDVIAADRGWTREQAALAAVLEGLATMVEHASSEVVSSTGLDGPAFSYEHEAVERECLDVKGYRPQT
jgi:hypothetical protein